MSDELQQIMDINKSKLESHQQLLSRFMVENEIQIESSLKKVVQWQQIEPFKEQQIKPNEKQIEEDIDQVLEKIKKKHNINQQFDVCQMEKYLIDKTPVKQNDISIIDSCMDTDNILSRIKKKLQKSQQGIGQMDINNDEVVIQKFSQYEAWEKKNTDDLLTTKIKLIQNSCQNESQKSQESQKTQLIQVIQSQQNKQQNEKKRYFNQEDEFSQLKEKTKIIEQKSEQLVLGTNDVNGNQQRISPKSIKQNLKNLKNIYFKKSEQSQKIQEDKILVENRKDFQNNQKSDIIKYNTSESKIKKFDFQDKKINNQNDKDDSELNDELDSEILKESALQGVQFSQQQNINLSSMDDELDYSYSNIGSPKNSLKLSQISQINSQHSIQKIFDSDPILQKLEIQVQFLQQQINYLKDKQRTKK